MKIKKLNYTKQGYSYLKCTVQDCYEWGGAAICDSCGEKIKGDVFLIYILGQAFCSECFEDWTKRSKRYEDDIKLQKQNHNRWYKAHGFNTILESMEE